ncbi:MAG: hypothetical protein JSV63_02925 [Candidatus Aenigmatarchaeota archaeon]|nr:MAG: hypothetical protein JSV63_02925 [Candidatus Aenigmarchaeota archaeon]
MTKGSSPITKPLFAVFALLLFVVGLVYLMWMLSIYLSNPCWSDVLKGLQPLAVEARGPKILIFDECVDRYVITSDRAGCQLICNQQSNDDLKKSCTEKCNIGSEDEARTFIIAVPKQRGFFKSAIDTIAKRNLKWLFDGKTEVFDVECVVTDVDGIQECRESSEGWICTPKELKRSYRLKIDYGDLDNCIISVEGINQD